MSARTLVSQDQNEFTPTESTSSPSSSLLPRRVHTTLAISPLPLRSGLSSISPTEVKLNHDEACGQLKGPLDHQAYIGSVLKRLRRRHYNETSFSWKSLAGSCFYYLKTQSLVPDRGTPFGCWTHHGRDGSTIISLFFVKILIPCEASNFFKTKPFCFL
jgi:hypothetical protein